MKFLINFYALLIFVTINALSDPQSPEYEASIKKNLTSQLDMIFFSINTTALNLRNDKGSDVLINAAGLDPISNPDIYISKKNKFPSSYEEGERKPCNSFKTDTCVITNNEIQTNQTFYVGIKCLVYPCQIVYSVSIKDEHLMYLNESRYLRFDKLRLEDSIIFNVRIPDNMTFESILFKALLINAAYVEQPIIMNVGKNNPSTGDDEYYEQHGWGRSKVLKLSKNQVGDTKNFKVLIEGGNSSVVLLSVRPLKSHEMIQLNDYYEEQISNDVKTNYYKLAVDQLLGEQESQDLEIYMYPYSGQPKLYIHCGAKRPDSLSDYKWDDMNVSRVSGNRIIQPEQRADCKSQGEEIYYLAVNSDFSSTYILQVTKVNNSNLYLGINRNTFGSLYKEKLHNYNLIIYQNPEKFNISINLHNFNTNNYFWVLSKQCVPTNEACAISLSEIKQGIDKPDQDTEIYGSKVIGSNLIIQISPKAEKCELKYYSWRCQFSITLYMDSTQPEDSMEYEIIALHSNAFTTLKEGVTVHQFVYRKDCRQFQINIQKSSTERVKQVTFSLTSISGDQRFFVDNKTYDSSQTDLESVSQYSSSFVSNQIQILEDQVQYGTYYIYVKGYNTGYFTIQYQMTKENIETGELSLTYVTLKKDLFSDQYLSKTKQTFYFQAQIKTLEDHFIKINPIYGVYVMYIASNNTSPPSKDYFTWQDDVTQSFGSGRRNIIEIRNKSSYFPPLNTIVYGVVEIDTSVWPDPIIWTLGQDYHFSIVLHTSSSVHELIEGKNFNTKIDANDSHTLKFLPTSYEDDFTLSFDAPTKDKSELTVYYKIGMFQRFPSDLYNDGNDGYITGDQKILKINSSQFQSCIEHTTQNDSCLVYISVESKIDTSYSIIITKDECNKQVIQVMKLIEGESLQLPSLKKNESRNFYYIIHANYGLDIYLYSIYNNLRLYGSIIKIDNGISSNQYLYPNSTYNNFSNYQSVYLNESQIQLYCDGQCILLLTIDLIDENYYHSPNDTFTIKVIQDSLFHIDEGIPYYGYVQQDDMLYYAFTFNTPNKTIFISLHGIGSTSNPDLYVAYERYPSSYDYDYQSSSLKGDFIAINNESRTGWYMIGVFGFNSSKYALQIQVGDFIFMNLYANEQFYIDLNKNQTAYYSYYHYSNYGFSVQNFITQGQATMGVKIMEDDEVSAFKCSDGDYISDDLKRDDNKIIIKSEDKKFCIGCKYLIAVCSRQGASLNVMVNVEGESIILRTDTQFKNQLAKDQKNYYTIYVLDNQKIKLQVTSQVGGVKVYINNSNIVTQVRGGYSDMSEVSTTDPVNFYLEYKTPSSDQSYFYYQQQFTILVVGQLGNNVYSILASEHQQKTLSFRVPIYVDFLPQKLNSFQFTLDNQIGSQNRQISIYLTSKNGAVDFGTLTKDDLIDIRIKYSDGNKNQYVDLYTYSDKSLSSQYYIYSLENMPSGIFTFDIKNKYHRQYSGVVVIENGGMNAIVQDHMYTQISKENQHYQYECYIDKKQKIVIEFNQCAGQSVLKAYKEYNQLLKDEKNINLRKLGPQHSYFIIQNQSLIFFKVHAYSFETTNKEKINQFTFKIKSFPISYQFPQEYMSPGNEGKIRFRWNDDKLSIRVNKIQCEENMCWKNLNQTTTSIVYILYIGKNQTDLQRDVYCNSQADIQNLIIQWNPEMTFNYHQTYIGDVSDTSSIDFQVNKKNLQGLTDVEYLWFWVKAVVKINDEQTSYYETSFYYNPQELLMTNQTQTVYQAKEIQDDIVQDNTGQTGVSNVWIVLAIVTILGLTALVFLIYQKLRKTQSQLNYEMTDIRNIAREGEQQQVKNETSHKDQLDFAIISDKLN